MATNKDHVNTLKQDVAERYAEVKALALTEVVINEHDLDGESLRTPRLHSTWLSMMGDEAVKLKQIQNIMKKLALERSRFFLGTQTDKYYAEHGQPHVRVPKTDLPLYLDADDQISALREVMEIQTQLVDFLEKTVKEISSRTYHLRAAIDWRKFESGA